MTTSSRSPAPIRGATASLEETSVVLKLPSVLLKAGEDRRVRSGHPWAFSNEILMDAETKALPAGSLVATVAWFMMGNPFGIDNAYVALVSPRAHRPSLKLKDAFEQMMRDADKAFDRRVLVALSNYLENRPAKLDWLTQTKQA